MELNERDIDWQKDAPNLTAIGNKIPFTLPAGYFDELSDIIKGRIVVESAAFESLKAFNTPEQYFQELAGRIEANVAVEQIKATTPESGFVLPEGYFADLTQRINSRIEVASAKDTKVRSLFTSWVGYAAAACITVMIATGIYFSSNHYNFAEELSEVPDQEIINYLQAHSTAGDTPFIIENINPDELEHVNPDVSAEELELYIKSTTL